MPVNIMIVEDHKAIRMALRNWLEIVFPKTCVTEAISGEEALTKILQGSPNVIIMDYKLPGMNGFEATQCIKHILPTTQIVMFSIREGDAYRSRAISAGAYTFIPKRKYQTELIPVLNTLLEINLS